MAIPARDRVAAAAGKLVGRWLALWRCRSGASAVEYGLIAVLIALALVAGATALGSAIAARFQWLADYFANS
jgi:pilus assembly protein Flp/PilA